MDVFLNGKQKKNPPQTQISVLFLFDLKSCHSLWITEQTAVCIGSSNILYAICFNIYVKNYFK